MNLRLFVVLGFLLALGLAGSGAGAGSASFSCAPSSGSVFPIGDTTVTCTATDSAGNNSSKTFKVSVKDRTPPVISGVPADFTSQTATVTYAQPTATDAVSGSVVVNCTPASGTTFPTGVTTVNCSATDGAGNTATASFRVTVADTVAPVITVPADITVEASSASGASVTYTVSATDNVDGNIPLGSPPPPPPPPSGANAFVATNGSDTTCVRGDSSKPCATVAKAYQLAQTGDTIEVGCGSYPAQSVPARAVTGVTIRKATGCTYVTLTGSMHIQASDVTVDGFSATNASTIWVDVPNGTSVCQTKNVTVQNFKASGVGGGCDHITFRNGDVGTNQNGCNGIEDGIQTFGPTSTGQFADLVAPTYIVIDNVRVHDTTGFSQCGSHTDGWQSFGCQHCTLRASTFTNNDTSDVIIYAPAGRATDVQDILIENNSFGNVLHPGHGVSIGGNACSADIPGNVVLQNNTFLTGEKYDVNCAGGKNAGTVRGNIVLQPDTFADCFQALTLDYNVFPGGSSSNCGAHVRVCTPAWADAAHTGGNVDLAASDTCAKDYIPTSVPHPATDIHGVARPQGAAVDAGADEA